MRLKYQIFLTLLAASALLIAIMFALSNWSFSRGFLEYVNQNERDRLSAVVKELIYQYEQQGSWDGIDDETLRRLLPLRDRLRPPPRNGKRVNDRLPGTDEPVEENATVEGDSANGRRDELRRGEGRHVDIRPTLILADANKEPIVGNAIRNRATQWIELQKDEQIIGYLGFPERSGIDRHFDQVFESKQRKNFLWAALSMILFSALLSIPLAGFIVRPLLKVNRAVDEISGGNFAHRIEHRRQDELGDLANNINTLGLSLEQNRDARQRWIAEISHELRTPVAVMRGELEAVQDGIRELDKPAINSLHSEALNLGRLIDDLHTLSMSDVGALNYQMESLSLRDLVQEFLAASDPVLVQHAITLTQHPVDSPITILGDAQRLEQMLSNLLQNTCRYTDAGGQLQVRLSQENQNGEIYCVIDWFDSNPGVEHSVLPELFNPLFRTEDSRSREHGGSGLGLSIVKRIVDAHQASIEASESVLGGLHLKIRFPSSANNS